MATLSSIAWRIPWTEEPGRPATVHGVAKSQTRLKQRSAQHSWDASSELLSLNK